MGLPRTTVPRTRSERRWLDERQTGDETIQVNPTFVQQVSGLQQLHGDANVVKDILLHFEVERLVERELLLLVAQLQHVRLL